jgi:hypothetical protein
MAVIEVFISSMIPKVVLQLAQMDIMPMTLQVFANFVK